MSINRILADLGKAVDSSSTGNFLNKEASGAEFNPVQWSDINSAPTILDSALASAIIDSAYIQARQTGVGSGGIDSATTIALIDSSYVGARASTGGSGFFKYQYTATASQTTFQDSDVNGNVLSYDADYILVHYNGVLLPSADYTATDGSSVVLGTGADSGSIIAIAKWGTGTTSSGLGSGNVWYGDRGVFSGGTTSSGQVNLIDYIDISALGNASDFGDLTEAKSGVAACSNGTIGVFIGGLTASSIRVTDIEYITIASPGNATSFGDITTGTAYNSGISDGTYGLTIGGMNTDGGSWIRTNVIEYITISTPGNGSDFGDLTAAKFGIAACSHGTYGISAGGNHSVASNVIEYVTIATPGNASDFGDLTAATFHSSGVSDTTYGVIGSLYGATDFNGIDYITIATPGNASDFGDFTAGWINGGGSGASNGSRGLFHAGNISGTNYRTNIEYVTIASPGNAADFGDLTVASRGQEGLAGSPS